MGAVVGGSVVVFLKFFHAIGGMGSGLGDGVYPSSEKRVFNRMGAIGNRRHACDAHRRGSAIPRAVERDLRRDARKGKTGCGLSHFDVRAARVFRRGGYANAREDFAGSQCGGEQSEEKVRRLHRALAAWPGNVELGIEGEHGGRPIRRGVRMGDAAAHRAPIANLHIADLACGFGQEPAFGRQQAMAFDGVMRRQRADGDGLMARRHFFQPADAAQVDDDRRRGKTQFHQRNQAVTAGEHFGVLAVFPHQTHRFLQGFGGVVIEGNHRLFSRMSFQSFSGRKGKSMCRTPKGFSASITALAIAGVEPIVPASPTPLTPMGLTGDGVTVLPSSKRGKSCALGKA